MNSFRITMASALAVLITASALATGDPASSRTGLGAPLTVMTRNVYLGTDLFPIFRATPARSTRKARLATTARAMHRARQVVHETDYRSRATLIAAEIADHEPALIGLQEVALWRHGDLELDRIGHPNASTVDIDFLEVLLAELRERDQDYLVAAKVPELDMEAPSFTDSPRRGRDIRLTLHDVILLRADAGLTITDRGQGHFVTQRQMRLLGRPVDFTRGYAWVDVVGEDHQLRFVNTHLEVGDPRTSTNQVFELIRGAGATRDLVVMVCDCNTDPQSSRRSMAYRAMTGAGFDDAWLSLPGADAGNTCCTASDLRDAEETVMDHRLDFVLTRSRRGVVADRGAVLGSTTDSRDGATGLWPSDHAGVVLRLRAR